MIVDDIRAVAVTFLHLATRCNSNTILEKKLVVFCHLRHCYLSFRRLFELSNFIAHSFSQLLVGDWPAWAFALHIQHLHILFTTYNFFFSFLYTSRQGLHWEELFLRAAMIPMDDIQHLEEAEPALRGIS